MTLLSADKEANFGGSDSSMGYAVEVAATHCTSVTDRQKKERRKGILKIAMHCTSKGHFSYLYHRL